MIADNTPKTKHETPDDSVFRFEHVPVCPYCADSHSKRVYSDLEDITFRCAPGIFSMAQCKNCGAGYLSPRPTADTIGHAYARYYTHQAEASTRYGGGILGLARTALANGYRNTRYGARLRPSIGGASWLIAGLPQQRRRIDNYFRHLPRQHGRLLDFGCGNGQFLKLAREIGWQCEGIDFDSAAVSAAQKERLDVRTGGIEEILIRGEGAYDAITAAHVIEHVHEPRVMLAAFAQALKPHGFLYLETPNFDSHCHGLFGKYWRGLEAPRHLAIATEKSLRLALTAAGFTDLAFHRRDDIFDSIYQRSAALKEGRDSESPHALTEPGPTSEDRSSAGKDPSKSEYLLVTARLQARESGIS
jgi:2-polyprenyl-3-methyl-5-hydroxy-6-metoxy-1,4-benzoquinol methylase